MGGRSAHYRLGAGRREVETVEPPDDIPDEPLQLLHHVTVFARNLPRNVVDDDVHDDRWVTGCDSVQEASEKNLEHGGGQSAPRSN